MLVEARSQQCLWWNQIEQLVTSCTWESQTSEVAQDLYHVDPGFSRDA